MTLQSNNSLVKSVSQEEREIIFIDATVEDYQSLIAGINPDTKVVILDRIKDGVSQITENLQGGKYKSVHIVSHGGEGSLQLGSKQLNSDNLDIYKSQLQQWANFLTDDADILLYGCDVAAGKTGVGFVQQLSQLTGADVAASDDLTGSAALGGDWDLEVNTGKIEAPLAFQVGVMETYNAVLASAGDVIINEFSQASSAKEWVEILVVKDNLDLRNHRLVDTNATNPQNPDGLDITLSGSGFSSLRAGTLIVLYNGGDVDSTITPDLTYNPTNGDYVLQISSQNNSGNFAVTRTTGWNSTTGAFGNGSTTDAPRLLNASGTEIYKFPKAPTPMNQRATAYLSNTASGATDATKWSADFASAGANPGLANGGVNTTWINSLRGNNAPVLNTAGNPTTLPSINEDIPSASNTGILLADVIKNLITDTNNNAQGIAVTGLTGNGTWQYSFDGGINWTNFGAVSDTSAAVLAGLTPIYQGSLNSTPNTQGWLQFAASPPVGTIAPIGGTQSASGSMTNLVSTLTGSAGYSNYNAGLPIPLNPAFPTLDRNVGFTLSFDLQVNTESHSSDDNSDNIQDRAGFSVIVVTSDNRKAIELGFWNNEIWAQNDGPNVANGPTKTLFTHSSTERALRSTTAMTRYDLAIKDNTYQLFAAGGTTAILTGSLRDYTPFNHTGAGLPYDPYEQTNFVFLGDNTSSAQADVNLARVELQANNKVRFVPNTDYNGTADIKFRGWDGTSGTNGGTADTSSNGGITAFSSTTETASITVNSVNDAPVLSKNNINVDKGNIVTVTSAMLQVTDVDNTAAQLTYTVTSLPGQGQLRLSNVALSVNSTFTQDDINNNRVTYAHNNSESISDGFGFTVTDGQTTRVSVDSSGIQSNDYSDSPSISADGRYVVFMSNAANLVAEDTNNTLDIFRRDLQSGQTTRVSVDSSGIQSNNYSYSPSISADGRYVVFISDADNLVAGDTNNTSDIFRRDLQVGSISNNAVITVSVNDAPVLNNADIFTLTTINEDATNNNGTLITNLIGNKITDANTNALKGIAVTGVDTTYGSWEFSINGGTNWTNFNVSTNSATLLRDTAKIRFVPNPNYNGTISNGITFRAWDASDGGISGTTGINPGAGGGTSAFSLNAVSANIIVNCVNDRPTFTIGSNQSIKTGVAQTIQGWASGFNSGAANETQNVAGYTVNILNNVNADIFEVAPTINLAGDLIYKAKSGITASKTATIQVQVLDNGDTANGGVDTSDVKTFTITVNPTITNSMNGGSAIDNLTGTDGSDRISALDNDDTIYGGLGSDRIFGGNGNDTLYGELETIPTYGTTFSMDDTIAGGLGNDLIYGNRGKDYLYGEDGDDQIWGGAGNDEIWGGSGNDTFWGGADKDTFVLVRGQGKDIIEDFDLNEDKIAGAGGIKTFGSLLITQLGSDTLITDKARNQDLAVLTGINANTLNNSHFLTF